MTFLTLFIIVNMFMNISCFPIPEKQLKSIADEYLKTKLFYAVCFAVTGFCSILILYLLYSCCIKHAFLKEVYNRIRKKKDAQIEELPDKEKQAEEEKRKKKKPVKHKMTNHERRAQSYVELWRIKLRMLIRRDAAIDLGLEKRARRLNLEMKQTTL